ncbi:tRNA preQ1(34) S-adenosylmethionine ribosyltransferase-isomerase QueA [Beggiatoa leptomitoformis]|uniref:S-adenosylmethionine:tRNA ribosyltransferase-isomerase n=1 Tax=Beggiatoa leptomitoformis TaxID=288004 RepID=A0A2N9YJR1_9GAMM|nr:tRNA preQ1(34) S-adenosylmethionine ribosyltransferase-isomerase QueA [Beggiatoa leptomitoformis]ALG69479.1 tRNA preQ1(34) S-adenosylmethionine ribosyltransferase-isomerase QueA [Beggiatoa leptomitoformis]AUI70615.1 tRNA preQ1(34) S-adenosylmethionine ribosyltransferase-isomerase QueA [Beggiatoa leptomitoformis]
MRRSDFYYDLPPHLIAQKPSLTRTSSRLLHIDTQTQRLTNHIFKDFPHCLEPNDLLVFNNTKVIPARLFGQKATGGRVEILVERILDDHRILGQMRASKPPKPNTPILLEGGITVVVLGKIDNFFELRFADERSVYDILQAIGHIPLPPYIVRDDDNIDQERYQTVYAQNLGAVAAPTAGLHFDKQLLAEISAKGIQQTFVTLHVGAGTFSPIREEDLSLHVMHSEWVSVSTEVCEQIRATRARGGRVIAIGTTAVRALETASQSGEIQPYQGETRLFITPGYVFKSVDALLTNFHLPESTLLMLVSAFAGTDLTLQAYRYAVQQQYRFFSYGDAMWINHKVTTI